MTSESAELRYDAHRQCVAVDGQGLTALQWAELRMLVSRGQSSTYTVRGKSAEMEIADFYRILPTLKALAKRQGFDLVADSVRELVQQYVQDRASLQSAARLEPPDDVSARLQQNGFKRILTEEQSRDVARMLCLRHAANFSVPGAGKTTALLAVNLLAMSHFPEGRLLVVCPKNAFVSWDEEICLCLGDGHGPVRLGGGEESVRCLLTQSTSRIMLINYEQLRGALEPIALFMSRTPVHLVLDEAHKIKGGTDRITASAVLRIAPLARRRDILTGTPMPQWVKDLIPQFDFLWVGQGVLDAVANTSDPESVQVETASSILRPLFVRTTKSELGIPPYTIVRTPVCLPEAQDRFYRLILSSSARILAGVTDGDFAALRTMKRQVIRLLQAASNPALIGESDLAALAEYPYSAVTDVDVLRQAIGEIYSNGGLPGKLAAAEQLVRGAVAQGRKVLVWSIFVRNIEFLTQRFADLGAVSIHGGINTGDEMDPDVREGRIRLFKVDPECQVMVANPGACGEGISLHHVCHEAVYLERSFRAEHYLQSIDRIHRLGLKPSDETTIHLLEGAGTIDEVVHDRLEAKTARMMEVLGDDSLRAMAYDPDDIPEPSVDGLSAEDVRAVQDHLGVHVA